jgi:predicted protein tyrosine phosphatase
MRVLFVCNQNQHRSKTAEELFKNDFETLSAGLYNNKPLTKDQLEWADVVVVMEEQQREEIAKRFPGFYLKKQILNVEIADIYQYNQPELIMQLKEKINAALLVATS